MENKDFIVNDFLDDFIFLDTFGIPLTEEEEHPNNFYTLEEIKQEVEKRIGELNRIGLNFSPDKIVSYEIQETLLLTAATGPVAKYQYKFIIAKLAARKRNAKYLDNIIYHELCHMLQLDFLFDRNIIYYVDGKLRGNPEQMERVNAWYKANGGHNDIWNTFVRKVSSEISIAPAVASTLNDEDLADIFLESTFEQELTDLEIDGWFFDYFPEVMD